MATHSRHALAETACTAFDGLRRIASGPLNRVAVKAKAAFDRGGIVLIFDDETAEVIDLDYSGTAKDVMRRLEGEASAPAPPVTPRGRGRPRLGVVSREVTLLPRQWTWLSGQPGGASVTLRRLVDDARRANAGKDRVRRSQEVTYRFMAALAGDLPGFEEANRALFAADVDAFQAHVAAWPPDVIAFVRRLSDEVFSGGK
ncbi:MAG: DUF2239 family protein [Acidobacteriota bacterium]